MNEVIKWELIDALRSGDHVQTQDRLEQLDGAQCCLGVLCDIMDVPRHAITYPSFGGDPARTVIHYGTMDGDDDRLCDTELPNPVRIAAGLTSNEMCDLMGLNDDGYDFNYIAKYVEEVL